MSVMEKYFPFPAAASEPEAGPRQARAGGMRKTRADQNRQAKSSPYWVSSKTLAELSTFDT